MSSKKERIFNMILAADLFGNKHIMGLIICLVVIGLMFVLSEIVLKRNSMKVIYYLFGMFFVLEIIKISYMWYGDTFPMNHLPFHLCSLPLYLVPIIAFCKNEKVLKFAYPALVGGLLFGGIVAMLYPVNIIGDGSSFFPFADNVLPWISFIYHPLMIFTAIYVIYSGMYRIKFVNFIYAYPMIVIFMVLAMIMNVIFDKDFMLLSKGIGSPFQSFIETSQILYTGIMVVLGLFAIFLFHSLAVGITKVTKMDQ